MLRITVACWKTNGYSCELVHHTIHLTLPFPIQLNVLWYQYVNIVKAHKHNKILENTGILLENMINSAE